MNDLKLANRVLVSMMTAAAFVLMMASGIVAYVVPHGRIRTGGFYENTSCLIGKFGDRFYWTCNFELWWRILCCKKPVRCTPNR